MPVFDGCPNLRGTYANDASAVLPATVDVRSRLTDVLGTLAHATGLNSPAEWKQSWPVIPDGVSVVTIGQTSESLTLSFQGAAGDAVRWDFRRHRVRLSEKRVDDLFACRTLYAEPSLRFFAEPESHGSKSVIAIEGGGTFVVMLRSVDGSLVVNVRSDSAIVTSFALGSGYRVRNVWYRYPAVEPRSTISR